MTNKETKDKFNEVLTDLEKAATFRSPEIMTMQVGMSMPKVMRIVLQLIERQDELEAEIRKLKGDRA